MKNVFFALAFMLVGTFAFANTKKSIDDFSETNFEKLALEHSNDFKFSFNDNLLSDTQLLALEDCTLIGTFTITFPDGDDFTWTGKLTIVGKSCVEFLKELMAE